MNGGGTGAADAHATTVVLVGFMGAGKSTVGQALAERRGLPFIDCDRLIEQEAGPIEDIFAAYGEAGFRTLEREVVLRVLSGAGERAQVVALGGGAVLGEEVRSELAQFTHVVWLTASVDEAWERAGAGQGALRPLARDEASFRRLFDERAGLYAAVARARVASDGARDVGAVVEEIVRITGGDAPRSGGAS
jgi:shikimate kinase